jgi:16S rRNA (uracil1498-N3)-methyltransferase
MRVPRVFTSDLDPHGRTPVALDARAAHHLRTVLRLRAGERVRLFDGRGWDLEAELTEVPRRGAVRARPLRRIEVDNESPLPVTLCQGISRGERMDFALQKSVELGVARIVPLWTERSARRFTGPRMERRLAHWRGVIVSACEQCGRARIPELVPPLELEELEAPRDPGLAALWLDPAAGEGLGTLPEAPRAVWLVAGPEGGFSERERGRLRRAGFHAVRLGPRVLRTETAALAALAAVQTRWGDLGA